MPRSPLPLAIATTMFALHTHAAHVYISSPGDGNVTQYRLDERSGALTHVHAFAAANGVAAMTLSPGGEYLYAAAPAEKGNRVLRLAIEASSGQLQASGEAPLADRMSYLSTSHSGRFLYGASYGGGLISIQPAPVGPTTGDPVVYRTGPNTHSIRVSDDDRHVYAAVLGADRIAQFAHDTETGKLVPIGEGFISTPTGMGPRHLIISPGGKHLYVVGELTGTVIGYAIDASTGALNEITRAEGIPPRMNLQPGVIRGSDPIPEDLAPKLIWAADIRLTPDGTLLYISERTTSSVSAFRVNPATGELTFIDNFPLQEKQPRNIAISPSGRWLIASGEKSPVIGSYRIDESGAIERVGEAPAGKSALWIEMLPEAAEDSVN
ncbi:lactonase family protein [Pseudomonas sp. Marseille-QA0892]